MEYTIGEYAKEFIENIISCMQTDDADPEAGKSERNPDDVIDAQNSMSRSNKQNSEDQIQEKLAAYNKQYSENAHRGSISNP